MKHCSRLQHNTRFFAGTVSSAWQLDPSSLVMCRLWVLGGPLVLQNLFTFGISLVAVAFVGHLNSATLLSSVVMANTLFNVTGYSVMAGLASGMETLCGQVSHTMCPAEKIAAAKLCSRCLVNVQVGISKPVLTNAECPKDPPDRSKESRSSPPGCVR